MWIVQKCSVKLKRLESIQFNCKGGLICIRKDDKKMPQKISKQRLKQLIKVSHFSHKKDYFQCPAQLEIDLECKLSVNAFEQAATLINFESNHALILNLREKVNFEFNLPRMRFAIKVGTLQRENRRLRKKAIEVEKQLVDLKKMVTSATMESFL